MYVAGPWKNEQSMFNVVNPDDVVERYGADTLRIYEMFLGPLEQSKPWDTNGIDGVYRFIRKMWSLYHKGDTWSWMTPSLRPNLKSIHKLIKKVSADIENFSFNTSVAAFMICVNELASQGCRSRAVLEPLAIVAAPFAPMWRKPCGARFSAMRIPYAMHRGGIRRKVAYRKYCNHGRVVQRKGPL